MAKKKVAPRTESMDETKRKFREALAAKHGREAEGQAHLDAEPRDTHTHGPVDSKRTFRRKTG